MQLQTRSWIYILPGPGQITERPIPGPGQILKFLTPAQSYQWSFTDYLYDFADFAE
jgi:hypothetical protein